MKKLLIFVVLALFAIVPAVSAQTCDCEGLQAQIDALTARIEALEGNAPVVEADQEEPATAGDFEQVSIDGYTLDYIGYELAKNYKGEDIINISYTFTNNSDKAKSFMWALNCTAFQDGIELKDYYGTDTENSTDIRPGKSITVISSYYLRSMSEPIELNFDPLISFNSEPAEIRYLNLD